jgi:hypothetical protein
MTTRKSEISAYVIENIMYEARERVSEVDLMGERFPSSVKHRWAEGISLLRQIRSQIVAAAGRTMQGMPGGGATLIPIPVRAAKYRRHLGQGQSRD